jgi:type II secretory pathway pseudopilin PulG
VVIVAAIAVLAGVLLALRAQRRRRAQREQERLQSRRSGRDSLHSQTQLQTETLPRRSRIDDDFEVALDIDLDGVGQQKPAAPVRIATP